MLELSDKGFKVAIIKMLQFKDLSEPQKDKLKEICVKIHYSQTFGNSTQRKKYPDCT